MMGSVLKELLGVSCKAAVAAGKRGSQRLLCFPYTCVC